MLNNSMMLTYYIVHTHSAFYKLIIVKTQLNTTRSQMLKQYKMGRVLGKWG